MDAVPVIVFVLFPKDPRVKIERSPNQLVLRWKYGVSGLSWMAVFFGSFLILMLFTPPTPDRYGRMTRPLDVWPGLVSVSALSYLTALALWLNSVELVATKSELVFKHGPIFPKRRSFDMLGIKQFFVKQPSSVGNRNASRGLAIIDSSDHLVTITNSFPSYHSMNQVAHELQDFYGLEDLPIYGETTHPHHPGPRKTNPKP